MPRRPRIAPGGLIYHVLNRAVGRSTLFEKPADYQAFLRVLGEALVKHPTRLLAYCIMPNHWHLVLWPRRAGELTDFTRWLTHTHTMRWHAHYKTTGSGHLYQGRFKAFPIEEDQHLYAVLRYVERNALRARLVRRAENWRWGSLWLRQHGDPSDQALLHSWPLGVPADWCAIVNEPQTDAELEAIRRSLARGCPYGKDAWQKQTARKLRLEYTLRPRGRPSKNEAQK